MKKIKPDFLPLQLDLFSSDIMQILLLKPDASKTLPPVISKPRRQSLSPEKRTIELNHSRIEYEFRRSKRKTIGFLVNESGLRVTAPRWITLKLVEDAIREKESWIIGKFRYFLHHDSKQQAITSSLQNGTRLPYLGRHLGLRLCHDQADAIIMNEQTQELMVASADAATQPVIRETLKKWFQEKAQQIFAERLSVYAAMLDVTYRSLSLSSAKHRWGSCSVSGNIRLNWRLVHFPLALIDYVIVHELAHLLEMNHSRRFWDIVSMAYPDYRTARKQLNQQNRQMLSLL